MAAWVIQGAPVPWHLLGESYNAGSNAPARVCLSAAFWEQDVLLTPVIPL